MTWWDSPPAPESQAPTGTYIRAGEGITVIVETGIWVHHPSHFVGDSHAHAAPLYDRVKAWAVETGYPVVDVYQKMQAEAAKGNWDLRVRGLPTPEQTVIDDTFDEFF